MSDWLDIKDIKKRGKDLDGQIVSEHERQQRNKRQTDQIIKQYDSLIREIFHQTASKIIRREYVLWLIPADKPYKIHHMYQWTWQLAYNTHRSHIPLLQISIQGSEEGKPIGFHMSFGNYRFMFSNGAGQSEICQSSGNPKADIEIIKNSIREYLIQYSVRAVYTRYITGKYSAHLHWVVEYGSELQPQFMDLGEVGW